ncbi:MAG: UDP-glucose 4-epimerase GalE [Candidatus Omnitrophica bacterium]|nr:UDP-glucose 4-epimerase GalE [Candidatus Omnitrophota bacterium]
MTKKSDYILVTGGAGYIGGHMAGMLVEAGYKVVVFDNLSTGVKPWIAKGARFVKGDLGRLTDVQKLFKRYRIAAVMHFAAKIVVPESVSQPIMYYRNNVGGTLNLLQGMSEFKVKKIVFSSTAAVYGSAKKMPITEATPVAPLSPYGASKFMVESVLEDAAKAGLIEYIALRYFNVAGWDTHRAWPVKGRPVPTHLISNAMKALHGAGELGVCGNDYNTPDGTGVRDFIHVVDLCWAHLRALKALSRGVKNEVFNLGADRGFSVLEVIKAAEKVTGKPVPHHISPRRPGDVEIVVASSDKARKILGWVPKHTLCDILRDEWERKWAV